MRAQILYSCTRIFGATRRHAASAFAESFVCVASLAIALVAPLLSPVIAASDVTIVGAWVDQ